MIISIEAAAKEHRSNERRKLVLLRIIGRLCRVCVTKFSNLQILDSCVRAENLNSFRLALVQERDQLEIDRFDKTDQRQNRIEQKNHA